jgi:hypothetical protein
MRIGNRLAVFAVGCAMITAPLFGAAAETMTTMHHRHFVDRSVSCPMRRTAGGTLVDCHGWRLRSGTIGWDNTCFNLDYLPSRFACSGNGGGGN